MQRHRVRCWGGGWWGPQAVLGPSGEVPHGTPQIRGWDFDDGNDLDGVLGAMLHSGFQATSLGQGIAEVKRMVRDTAAASAPPHPRTPARGEGGTLTRSC